MKRKLFRNKQMRYGTIAVLLTVMVLVVAVLANMVVSAVVTRYELNPSLVGELAFDVTEDCYAFLDEVFSDARAEKRSDRVKILFCDTRENVSAEGSSNYYLYHTADAFAKRFSNIEVQCHDIIANPAPVKQYMHTTNPLTGEKIELDLYSDSVIVIAEDFHRVYAAADFYVYSDEETTEAWAYSGERELASAMMHAVSGEERIACLLNNHGEVHYDYELLNLLTDAGYTVVYLDLYKDPIPTSCDLIISYNPNTDLLTGKQLSDRSEMDILDEFLSKDGSSFLVFLENGTPKLPNFEKYLSAWGVATDYSKNSTTGVDYRYMVQDSSGALTTDGYTIYGEVTTGASAKFNDPAIPYVVFRNATSLSVTGEGYIGNGDGSYKNASGTRTLYPLYMSRPESVAYANGGQVASGATMLASVTEQTQSGATSYVGVVSSVQFATSRYLQSAVYGNTDALLHLLECMGLEHTTKGLSVKPFLVQDISTATTSDLLFWTLTLSITPAVLATVTGAIILVRRRRA